MQSGPEEKTARISELDALRGMAAVAVLICHLPRGFWFGQTGVDLFFVLSGFLITGIILRNLEEPGFLRTFYWRRSLRIFPIYYLALLVAYSMNALRSTPQDVTGFPFYLVYLQHIHLYWGSVTPPANISLHHTWTLAIEEQFYLCWPFALVFLKRRTVPWLIGLFIVLPVVLRHLGLSASVLLGHTDGLALGAMLAWVMLRTESVKRERKVACYAGITIVAFIAYWVLWEGTAAGGDFTGKQYIAFNPAISIISVAYFGLIGLIVCMSGSRSLALLRNKYLVGIGTISYGLYLYHWIIYEAIDTVIKFRWKMGDPLWLDVIKVATVFLAAILSWRFIERPILRLKSRYDYHRANRADVIPMQPASPSSMGGARSHG
jgi:peptidoglycan/LPS O-acetylase OafA/YrhL